MIKLGNTDLKVSSISLGTATLGVNMSVKEVDSLLGTYIEGGGNFLDTAHVYSDWIPGERCRSEKTLGSWLKRRKKRHDLIIGTKGAHPDISSSATDGPQDRMSAIELRKDLEESLAFLGTDYIDIYWLHRDNLNYEVEEILGVLESFLKEGKIRSYGCSNWNLERLRKAQNIASEKGWQGFTANQIEWSCALKNSQSKGDPSMVNMDRDFYSYHRETGLLQVPYASQAQGLYSKVKALGWESLKEGDKRKYDLKENREIFSLIEDYDSKYNLNPAAFSLAYHFSQPDPVKSIPIIGTTKPERVKESMGYIDLRLPLEIVEKVNALLNL
jgi:aryl-alcohol dehydrogenase-like predicted oxidoreductase